MDVFHRQDEVELMGAVELNYWRERVLNNFIFLSVSLGIFALGSLFFLENVDRLRILWVGALTYSGLLLLFFVKKIPLQLRMYLLLIILLMSGVGALFNFGTDSPGLLILFTF